MDVICKKGGCYIFAAETPEREACEQDCSLERGARTRRRQVRLARRVFGDLRCNDGTCDCPPPVLTIDDLDTGPRDDAAGGDDG